ncbi:MAG: fibronectin type III domain-containing protein [Kiritimatiellae bacterium]|nr:fibronectin type III domain-containing protein [Kiritimatiellia bacterium]
MKKPGHAVVVFAVFALIAAFAGNALAGHPDILEIHISLSSGDWSAIKTLPRKSVSNPPEKRCTVKFKYPADSTFRHTVTCGIRPHGAAAVQLTVNNVGKNSFRLKFRGPEYGAKRLNFPVFARAPLNAHSKTGFDNLVLRGGGNDSWKSKYTVVSNGPTFINDEWMRATRIAMSGWGCHGTYAHLYVNGQYWGLYNVTERADRAWASMHFGGLKQDYASQRDAEGSLTRFNAAVNACVDAQNRSLSELRAYVSLEAFADYMMLGMYVGIWDWGGSGNKWNVTRGNPAGLTYHTVWDGELCWVGWGRKAGETSSYRVGHYVRTDPVTMSWHPDDYHFKMFAGLMKNQGFKQIFSDRIRKHIMTSGGALTETKNKARWNTLKSFIKNDIQADASRWGGSASAWSSANTKILNTMTGNDAEAVATFDAKGWILDAGGDPPAAPSGLAASATSASRIKLTWKDNSPDEDGFKIDRRRDGATTWIRIVATAANATAHTDSGLPDGTTFYYKIKAYNGDGDSAYSAVAAATTPKALTPPAAPSGLTASASSSSKIQLGWADNSSNEDVFEIDRRQSGLNDWVRIAEPAANTTAHTDSGLSAGTRYYYQIRASNAAGDSAYSAIADATTRDDTPPPEIAVSATTIDVTVEQNGSAAPTFDVWNCGGGTLDYLVVEDTSHYDISPAAGSSSGAGDTHTHTLTINTTVPVGRYARTIAVQDDGSGATNGPVVITVNIMITDPAQASGTWSAYHDLGWLSGQPAANITTGAGGTVELVRHDTGRGTGVMLAGSYAGSVADNAAGAPTRGTDADAVFGGIVDCDGFIYFKTDPITLTFRGLETNATYEVVVFGNRAGGYLDRLASVTISRAAAWENASTPGADFAGTADASVTICNGENTDNGFVARFRGVAPGADGEFTLTLALGGGGTAYFNALALRREAQTVIPGDDDGDGMADAWEEEHFGGASTTDGGAGQDFDGDGFENWEEYVAGSDPAGADSVFAVDIVLVAGQIEIRVPTTAAGGAGYEGLTRHYELQQQIESGDAWTVVPGYTDIVGLNQTIVYRPAGGDDASTCYRARVWLGME